jgi:hypothetical protein
MTAPKVDTATLVADTATLDAATATLVADTATLVAATALLVAANALSRSSLTEVEVVDTEEAVAMVSAADIVIFALEGGCSATAFYAAAEAIQDDHGYSATAFYAAAEATESAAEATAAAAEASGIHSRLFWEAVALKSVAEGQVIAKAAVMRALVR